MKPVQVQLVKQIADVNGIRWIDGNNKSVRDAIQELKKYFSHRLSWTAFVSTLTTDTELFLTSYSFVYIFWYYFHVWFKA